MKTIAVGFLLLLSNAVYAQWGTGVMLGNYCPQGYGPAPGAQHVNDRIANMQGQLSTLKSAMAREKSRLAAVNRMIEKDKAAMAGVLNPRTIDVIQEHFNYDRGAGEYSRDCAASAGDSSSNVQRLPSERQGGANSRGTSDTAAGYPSPGGGLFCAKDSSGTMVDQWQYYARDNGRVDSSICDDEFGGVHRRGVAESKRSACRNGLENFYQDSEDKREIEQIIDQLRADLENKEREIERERYDLERGLVSADDVTEGGICPSCHASGYSRSGGSSIMNFLGQLAPVLIQGGLQYYQTKQQNKLIKRAIDRTTDLGWPVYGPQYNMIRNSIMGPPPMGPMPGWGANPYASPPIPGYMGGYNGMYGAVPGMMGGGAFGCGGMGMNPYAMNPLAPGLLPFPGPNMSNPFGNPFLQNPYMSGMNPGAGPWGMPGMDGFNPFGGSNFPYGPNMGMNNPYSPGGAPPYLPYMGSQYPYMGMNPYGPPGMGMNPYGPPGMGMNPYGGPPNSGYNPNLIGALYGDLYSMQWKLNILGNGNYGMGYGGSGYGAPPYLPYPGPNPYPGYYTNPQNPYPYTLMGTSAPSLPGVPSLPTR